MSILLYLGLGLDRLRFTRREKEIGGITWSTDQQKFMYLLTTDFFLVRLLRGRESTSGRISVLSNHLDGHFLRGVHNEQKF